MSESSASLKLLQELNRLFGMNDVKKICFGLSEDFDNISGDTKEVKIQNLLELCRRNGRLSNLESILQAERPHIDWHALFEAYKALYPDTQDKPWREIVQPYYDSLREEVGTMRVLGKRRPVPLEDVFTAVNLLNKITAEQRHSINDLREITLRDFDWHKRVTRIAGDEVVDRFQKLFILGKPGAGKTTFLKHIALRAIDGELDKLPLFISLKELSDSKKPLLNFIAAKLDIHKLPNAELFIEQQLEHGNCLVLLDGLDEVNLADNQRAQIIQMLNNFITKYSRNSFLMTCRVAATDYSFYQMEYAEMADFDTDQMEKYINLWFAEDAVKREACRQQLLHQEENKAVRELAQVPLLLSLLCLVFEERGEFPPNRDEIYDEATRALLLKWDSSRNIRRDTVYGQLSLKHKQKLLAHIAFHAFERGEQFLKEETVVRRIEYYLRGVPNLEEADGFQILNEMEANHGIFVERARHIHSFSHLTLQEYYAALYIKENEQRDTVAQLMVHVGDDRWNEVFQLTASMLEDATEFCNAYLHAAWQLIANEEPLTQLIDWAINKRPHQPVAAKPAVRRSFMLFLSLDIDLDRARVRDRDLDVAHASVLVLDLARGHTLDLAHALDLDHAIELNYARDLARNLAHALDLAHAFTVAQDFGLMQMSNQLDRLSVPERDAPDAEWRSYLEQFVAILDEHEDQWNPYKLFQVTEESAKLWETVSNEQLTLYVNYMEANRLLVKCLAVAYVPNRQAIEDQILLPLS